MLKNDIAKVCYEVNRAYCEAMGDESNLPWDECVDEDGLGWQVDSYLKGVNFFLDSPEAGPEAQHQNWMQDRLDNGWIYGPTHNLELKQHPCMVPFDKLSEREQAKDRIFQMVIRCLREHMEAK